MWRRKIDVPDHLRLTYQREITLALDGLRREDEYIVHIDEYVKFFTPRRSVHILIIS